MPTVLRIGPYRFHFYSRENDEPPHIHVAKDDLECKFWLDPVSLGRNHGFTGKELNKLASLVAEHQTTLLNAWKGVHG
jgi:hypothetical protein